MTGQIHGGDIYTNACRIDFSANLNPLGMPKRVEEAACEGVRLSAHYPDVRCRALREAIAGNEQLPVEWVLCGNGAAELIFALACAVKPRKALLTAPGFAEYEQALRCVDCSVTFYPCRESSGFALQEDYLQYLTEDLDLVFLCNPANPTGLLIDPGLLEQIADRCRERKILLVVDECFNGLLEHAEEVTLKGRLGAQPGLFLLRAFTKLYAMAGLRLGYGLCADVELMERLRGVLQPWNVSLPAQMAGVAALREREYVVRSRAFVAKEREFLRQSLEELGLKTYDSRVNFLFFRGPEELARRCGEEGILIRDCRNYRGLEPGYYRIAVRAREENCELLRVLKDILEGGYEDRTGTGGAEGDRAAQL